MSKYGVILADPPWTHHVWGAGAGKNARTALKHYPVMTVEEIAALPIKNLAADNCALFMWTVWPNLFRTEESINAWGFEYRTVAWVWAKLNRSGLGFFMGLGHYSRANTEVCLLAIKGSMPVAAKDVLALTVSPRREHSRKPDEQYGKIERLYPDEPKLEMFARRQRPGWDVWGNEIRSTITMEDTR